MAKPTDEDVNGNRALFLLLAVLAGFGGTAGYQQINPPRIDPFRGTQAIELETRLKREFTLALRELELAIREDMPPTMTRQRIRDLERMMERVAQKVGEDYERPYGRFSDEER